MQDKINIFMFWLGNDKKNPQNIKTLNKRFPKLNFIIGPNKDEHNFLMNNVEFYKKSFEQKIYSFCSDVWRVWVLSKNKGLYIDIFTSFGDQFERYVSEIKKYDYFFIKWYPNDVAAGFLGRFNDDKIIFDDLFNIFKNRKNISDTRIWEILPTIITIYLTKKYNFNIDKPKKQIINNKILLEAFPIILDKRILFNKGSGSWLSTGKGLKNAESIRNKLNKIWIKKRNKKIKIEGRQFTKDQPSVKRIRHVFDYSLNKSECLYLINEYKKINNKKITERIIWSKLFKLFTFKLCKK